MQGWWLPGMLPKHLKSSVVLVVNIASFENDLHTWGSSYPLPYVNIKVNGS